MESPSSRRCALNGPLRFSRGFDPNPRWRATSASAALKGAAAARIVESLSALLHRPGGGNIFHFGGTWCYLKGGCPAPKTTGTGANLRLQGTQGPPRGVAQWSRLSSRNRRAKAAYLGYGFTPGLGIHRRGHGRVTRSRVKAPCSLTLGFVWLGFFPLHRLK